MQSGSSHGTCHTAHLLVHTGLRHTLFRSRGHTWPSEKMGPAVGNAFQVCILLEVKTYILWNFDHDLNSRHTVPQRGKISQIFSILVHFCG